jgi:hypothetical protein
MDQPSIAADIRIAASLSRRLIERQQVIKTYQSAAGAFTALKAIDPRIDAGSARPSRAISPTP